MSTVVTVYKIGNGPVELHIRVFGTQGVFTLFWDPALLATNDMALSTPSAATIGTLHDRCRVPRLFVDRAVMPACADLGQYVALRFTDADYAIYEIGPQRR